MQPHNIYAKVAVTDPDYQRPRELLSNTPAYFDLLFELLSLPRECVVASAWGVLQQLAVNEGVRASLQQAVLTPSVAWGDVLSGAAPLRLHYCLNIVQSYISPGPKATPEAVEAGKEWCEGFVARGGVTHLLSLLSQCDVSVWVASPLPLSCLTLLIQLIVAFLAADRWCDAEEALAGADTAQLASQLLCAVECGVMRCGKGTGSEEDDDIDVRDEGLAEGKSEGKGEEEEEVEGEEKEETTEDTKELLQSKMVSVCSPVCILGCVRLYV